MNAYNASNIFKPEEWDHTFMFVQSSVKVRLSTVPQPFKEQTIDKNHIFKAPFCNIELRANG